MKEDLVIIGTGLSAKQVYDFIKLHDLYNVVGFSVDSKYIKENTYLGIQIIPLENLKEVIDIRKVKVFVSLGWNHLNADRRMLYGRLKGEGYRFANLVSPLAIIKGKIVGENCWINDYSVLQSDSIIKSNVIVRELALIGNGTVIEEHCFLGVNSIVGGGSKIGEQSFLGIRATVFDGTSVGKKCIVGACAVAKRNIPDYNVCKTGSEVSVIKQYDETEIEQKLVAGKGVR